LALLVVGLAAQLVVHRRRGALLLTRARGASTAQLVGVLAVEALLVSGAAALAGLAVAVALVPARSSALSIGLVVALVAGCVAFMAVGCWRVVRRAGHDGRADTVAVRPSLRRTAVEVLLVVVAVVGLVVVRRRGVGSADGADPYLATVPVLLAVGAGLLALRAYPYLLRPMLRVVRGAAGAVSFVSLARAARQPPVATLPLAVLLLGLGFSVFASSVETTVVRGQQDSAWRQVGGDYRFDSGALSGRQVRRAAAVDGVTTAVPALTRDDIDVRDEEGRPSDARLLALDPAAYADLAARAPAGVAPTLDAVQVSSGGAMLPVLASPGVAAAAGPDGVVTVDLGAFIGVYEARVVDIAESFPGDGGREFVVTDLAVLRAGEETPIRLTTLFVAADAGTGAAVADALGTGGPRVTVSDRREVLTETGELPFVDSTVAAFRLGVGAAAGYCLLAVVLALVLTAESRAGLLATLRTLGIDRRQARGLLGLELAPMVVVVVVVGLAVGIALPYLLVPAVDLTSFTAGVDAPPPRLDPMVAGVLAVGLVAVVAIAVALTGLVQRRRRLGDAVRMGADA